MIPAGGLGPSVSADFSYSKSSYHQDEADPTPTITGTPGGAFICTSGAVFVDTGSTSSSTGQIDLDASTIDTHLISYTVDGVTATANVGITASPFIDNTFSMQFDSASSQSIQTNLSLAYTTYPNISLACWVKMNKSDLSTFTSYSPIGVRVASFQNLSPIRIYTNGTKVGYVVIQGQGGTTYSTTDLTDGNWHHIVQTCEYDASGTIANVYVDGTKEITDKLFFNYAPITGNLYIGVRDEFNAQFFEGKIDEVAAWNTILSADAVTEIYDATNNNTGKALDLSTDYNNYTSSSNLQYWNRLGD